MNEVIKVTVNDNQEPIVSARQLHKTLEVKTRWWNKGIARLCFIIGYCKTLSNDVENRQRKSSPTILYPSRKGLQQP